MGRVDRFERRLQGMVGDAFARVFGGSVVPQEVVQALLREAEDHIEELAGGRFLAPNRFTVLLSPADLDRMAGDRAQIVNSLSASVTEQLADQGWDTYGEVVVFLERSDALHTGQFRTRSSVDPDASRRDAIRARDAGEAPMSQQPGHPEENGQYGYDRGAPGGYGQQTYAPPAAYDQSNRPNGYDQGEPREGYPQYGQQGHDPGYGQPGYQQQGAPPQLRAAGLPAGIPAGRASSPVRPARLRPAGLRPAGLRPAGLRPAGLRAAWLRPAGLRPAGLRPGLRAARLRPAGLRPAGLRPAGVRPGLRPAGLRAAGLGPAVRGLTATISLDDGSNRNFALAEGNNVIGRGQDSHFRLPDTGVSRRHLEISWDGQTATLSDLGSTNGTTVNGNPVQTWQLTDGDVIRVGHSSLVFRTQG